MKKIIIFLILILIQKLVYTQWEYINDGVPRFSPDLKMGFETGVKQINSNLYEYYLYKTTDAGKTSQLDLHDTIASLFSLGYIVKNDSNIYSSLPWNNLIVHFKYPNYKQMDTINLYTIARKNCDLCPNPRINGYIPIFLNEDTSIIILGRTWLSTTKGTQKYFYAVNNTNFGPMLGDWYLSPDNRKVVYDGYTNAGRKVFRSENSGITWTDSFPVPSYLGFMQHKSYDTIFAQDLDGEKMYNSTNGGRDWTFMFDIKKAYGLKYKQGMKFANFYFSNVNNGIFYFAGDTTFHRTVNGGKNWKSQTLNPPLQFANGFQDEIMELRVINDTLMYFTSLQYSTYRTENMGGAEDGGVGITYRRKENTGLNFSVLPNPAKDFITVYLDNERPETEVSLYNSMGQLMVSATCVNSTTINMQHLASGIYFIKANGYVSKTIVKE